MWASFIFLYINAWFPSGQLNTANLWINFYMKTEPRSIYLIVFLLQFKMASPPLPPPPHSWRTRNESGSSWKPRQKSYIAKAEERDASSSSSGGNTVKHCKSRRGKCLNVTYCFVRPRRLKFLNVLIASALCSLLTILFLPALPRRSNNSWVKKHEENRQKRTHTWKGGDCLLDIDTKTHAFHNHHLVVAENPRCNDNLIILNCMHYYIKELDILHDCSLLCLGILCQSCCGTEVQVEKTFNYEILQRLWKQFALLTG